MIVLNKADVLANAVRAYHENRLQAQHPDGKLSCKYRSDNGYCCAVGASLDDATAHAFDTEFGSNSVTNLQRKNQIKTDDLDFLRALQDAHDDVVTSANSDSGYWCEDLAENWQTFCRLLGVGGPAPQPISVPCVS